MLVFFVLHSVACTQCIEKLKKKLKPFAFSISSLNNRNTSAYLSAIAMTVVTVLIIHVEMVKAFALRE